jgi:hypothetical protein
VHSTATALKSCFKAVLSIPFKPPASAPDITPILHHPSPPAASSKQQQQAAAAAAASSSSSHPRLQDLYSKHGSRPRGDHIAIRDLCVYHLHQST